MGPGYRSVAPLSAGLFLLLSVAVLLRCAALHRLASVIGGSVALVSLGVLMGYAAGRFTESVPTVRQPATVTSLVLLAASLAILMNGAASLGRWKRQCAALLGLLAMGTCTSVLLSYGAGAPLLYQTQKTLMSMPAALSGFLLGLALVILPGRDTWPLAFFSSLAGKHPYSRGLLAVFLSLALGILVGGSLYLRGQLATAREAAQGELQEIADLKAGQIANWYQERQGDARQILQSSLIQGEFRRFLAGAPQAPSRDELRTWMEGLCSSSLFQRVVLFDAQGRVRLVAPPEATVQVEGLAPWVREAPRARDLVNQDLYRDPGGAEIHMNLWVPIPGTAPGGGSSEGLLLLQVDARSFLFPLIQSWPVRSASAETLLVRREGDAVLFLNELRHRPHSALRLHVPMSGPSALPAILAVQGREGLVRGLDYRGVPVLSAVRRVPGTPWSMVAKIDEGEIYGPLRLRGWIVGAILMGMVGVVALGMGLMLRHQETLRISKQLVLEREGRILASRYEHLLQHANDAILLLDGEGRILEANERAQEYYGRTLSEFRALRVEDLRLPEEAAESRRLFEALQDTGTGRFEGIHRRKDASTFPVQVSWRRVVLEGETFVLTFIQDITERCARAWEIEKLTQLYAALSQVNQAIVWTQSREALFAKICEVLVEFGGFRMAWFGWKEADGYGISVVGQWGDTAGYLQDLHVRWDESPQGLGPVGRAIREGRPCIFNNFLGVEEIKLWWEAAQRSGFNAVAAFPIRQGGEICGALAVYDARAGCFGEKEIALLQEAAMDVSFALDHLAGEEQHRRGEAALRESEEKYRTLIKTIPFGMDIVDEQGNILFLNPAMEALLGPSALGNRCWLSYKDDREPCAECPLKQGILKGYTTSLESSGVLGGRTFLITHTGMLYEGQNALLEIFVDVTAAKEAEAANLDLTAQLHQSQKLESLGSLAGGIAHDMNNVLGAILSLASVHREGISGTNPLAKALDTIIQACSRGRDVVRSLLYFAHKDLVVVGPVDLNELVRDMVQLLSRTTLQRISLELDLQEPLSLIRGDAAALSHALMNLCVNSVDAMPKGGGLRLGTRQLSDGQIQLSVKDSGEGMSEEVQKRALEPFFTTKPQGKGTGLGLSMVFGTVKSHGGSLKILSEPGQGTEILLRFPVLEEARPQEVSERAPAEQTSTPSSLRILLVDDDELIRAAVGPMLEILGHQVQSVDSGLGALSLFEDGLEVDLVILDMNMPGINGAETLQRLLVLRPAQRVLMASGHSDTAIHELLKGHPSATCIQKPFSLQEIRVKLTELGFVADP